jgi:sulfofructose kinase
MSARVQVVGLGLCVYDLTLLVDGYPEADTKIDALDMWHGGGGPVPNTLVALSRWGVSCAFVGTVGDDLWGRALRTAFLTAGVDVSAMELDPRRATPVASLHVDARTGHRTAVLGGDPAIPPPAVPAGLIENASVLHLDARHPQSCMDAAKRARSSGVAVSLDVGSPREGGLDLLERVDHLVVAERFARFASGQEQVEDMLRTLWRPNFEALVITCGEQGSVGRDRATPRVSCRRLDVQVVDTTGAGDVYHAGYLLGHIEGWGLARRMEFAAAAAALACTRLGARGHLPLRSEVESLLSRERGI